MLSFTSNKNIALTEGPEILEQILKELRTTKQTVDIAMAWFTNKDLLAEVATLCDKGIKVRIVLAKNDYNSSTALSDLKSKGAQVIHLKGSGYGMMHHKFCIIDSKRAITGSFNWTGNAVANSSENAIFTSDKEIINPLIVEFDKLLGKETKTEMKEANSSGFDDPFIEQLESITSALIEDYNHEEIERHGYSKSKESFGNSTQLTGLFDELRTDFKNSVFKNTSFRDRTLVKMDVLWEQKEQNIKALYVQRIENEEIDFSVLKESNEVKKQQKQDELAKIQAEKEENRFEKEKTENEIDDLVSDIDKLEANADTKPFWNAQNIFVLLGVLAFWFYLYLFYSSAIYILQYGKIEVERAIALGIQPRIEFFDPEALTKLSTKGWVEIFFAFLVVHIPISLSLSKLFVKKEWVANLMSYFIAIVIIDFFVAFSLSRALHEIKVLTEGVQSEQSMADAILNLDFFKVFIFGALPLMILKFLFQYVQEAYSDSQIDLVNNKLAKQIKLNKKKISRLKHEGEKFKLAITKAESMETELNSAIEEVSFATEESRVKTSKNKQDLELSQSKEIEYYESVFNKYRNSIEKGSATILKNAMESRISSSLVGWVRFLNDHFSQSVTQEKLNQIEPIKTGWINTL